VGSPAASAAAPTAATSRPMAADPQGVELLMWTPSRHDWSSPVRKSDVRWTPRPWSALQVKRPKVRAPAEIRGQNGGVLQAIIVVSTVVGLVCPAARARPGRVGTPGVVAARVSPRSTSTSAVHDLHAAGAQRRFHIHREIPASGYFALAGHDPVLLWLATTFPLPAYFTDLVPGSSRSSNCRSRFSRT